MLLSRHRWFNAILLVGFLVSVSEADEIRSWKDKEGRRHYSIFGSGGETADDAPEPAPPDRFSVEASLRRNGIRDALRKNGAALHQIGDEIRTTEESHIVVSAPGAPSTPLPPGAIQDLLDAQRAAFLTARVFEENKKQALDRLYRRERKTLLEIRSQWQRFSELRKEVEERYGELPIWWRDRLDCGPCPPLEEVEEALRPPPERVDEEPESS